MRLSEISKTAAPLKKSVQQGNLQHKDSYKLRTELQAIANKYTKNGPFEIKSGRYPVDLGVYYTGTDAKEAFAAGREIIGDLYDFFQKGPSKDIVRVKKVEDSPEKLEYAVIPTHDPRLTHETPKTQVRFTMNRKINADIALISIMIDASR